MKKLKLFFALFAMLALGVGNAWGAEVTETIKMKGFGGKTNNAYQNLTVSGTSDAGTAMVAYAYNGSTGQVRGNKTSVAGASVASEDKNKNWSLYNSEAMAGAIKAIKVTQTATGSNKFQNNLYVSLGTSSQGSITAITKAQKQDAGGTAQEINFTIDASKGYTYFKLLSTEKFASGTIAGVEVKVTYETTSGGGDEPVASLSANPTTVDFGTVYQGAEVESKTVAINFANLTGNVTYSGLSTPFSATGNISTTGDKITISADASTIGEYSQTLTIASTADSKTAEVTVKMNVVEKPAPTGTFTLHTGDLIEGDYVIYYSGKAMKAAVSSNRLGYEEVTPSGNEIVDPLAATIWHIAPSGDNWTVYNNNKGYAAGTGTKSQAGLVANLTGDNANKAAWTITASGNAYEFVNVWNKSKSVNANLRNNTTYGFACYATSTGGALSLYRKAGTKYNVTVSSATNGSVTASPTSAEAGATIALTITPDAGYVLDALTVTDASSNTIEVADNKFTMPASDVTVVATFKLNEKPAATLTLSKNGVAETFPGSWKQDDVVTLPSITSDCVKEFVGWSANPTCNVAPEYKEGDEYTLAGTAQTLYAVYATVGGGAETTAANTLSSNGWANQSQHKSLQIDENVKAEITGTGLSNSGKYYTSGTNWRLYQNENPNLTISTTIGELKSITFTFAVENTGTFLCGGTKLASGTAVSVSGTSATFTVGNSGSATNGQIRISKIEVVYTGGVSYSNYSTTCAAALANPTFSLAEGKYTEAKSVEITATEGTVYYTTDGTTPTASSTQYTGAIALNDCGEYTIKAIAISSDSYSDVVSATYTIKLPLTNSQAAPYTESEAIAVYDGDCYDNQDVYVKGTVKTATFYNSGTYTITLTNGFQFYKFYKDGSKTLFADGEINKGDVLVACGKLSKYNTTYQLAEGCYLVEHEPYTEPKTDISNTEATAYTVDKAFELIADVSSDLTKEVFVKGLVAVAPTSNPTADGQMTYKISDNGENTGNVLTVYLGLNLNGEKFTSKNDVQRGDYVVVKGKLLDYNSTYELNKGNQLVQHVKAATITIADITMEVGETKTIAATITPAAAKTEVAYSIKAGSDDCITLSDNNITAKAEGTATIVATIATAAEYMGKTVEFKVTVTPVNITTLPFAFDGGVDDIATTPGMSQKNLGNDYTSADSPKLRFDNTDDNVIIHFDSEPVELSFTLKQNGDNGATYTVYESEDGNTFSPVWVAGEIGYGKTQDVTVSLSDAARYVKFEYTNKIQGTNYALGKISITNTYSTPTTLSGKFSTGEYEYAEFATGNLQYKKEGENETWRFAKQQYQVVGDDNINVGDPAFEGWIDMFGWSTSETNYGVDPRNENVYYDGAFVDWSNLFPGEGWSTLSADQWKYLLNTRPNASSLKQIARVGSVVGIMLFPDNWNAPLTVTAQRDSYFDVDIHNYTLDQWAELEEAGALFLPAAGRRAGGYGNMINKDQVVETNPANLNGGHYKHQDNTNIYCYYWTSTINESTKDVSYLHNIQALGDDKYTIGTGAVWGEKGRYGQSVRLAKVTKQYYTREVDPQYYGTICLAKAAKFEGGSLYEVSYFDESTKKVYFDEIENGVMEAGMPYVFLAEKNVICAYYTSDTEESAQDKDGLYGTLVDITSGMNADGVYMIYRNQIVHSTNPDSYLNANRAYIKLTEVPGYNNPLFVAPAPVPGRKRISMGTQATNTATGVDEVQGNNVQSTKVLMDGTLYIFRNGKMYDAQGKLVK